VLLRWIDVARRDGRSIPMWSPSPTVPASRPGGFAGTVRKLGFFERLSVGWQLLLGAAAQSILVTRYITTRPRANWDLDSRSTSSLGVPRINLE
jgi:hypothetical protein